MFRIEVFLFTLRSLSLAFLNLPQKFNKIYIVVNYVGLQVQCLLLCQTLNKIEFFGHNLVKTLNI